MDGNAVCFTQVLNKKLFIITFFCSQSKIKVDELKSKIRIKFYLLIEEVKQGR